VAGDRTADCWCWWWCLRVVQWLPLSLVLQGAAVGWPDAAVDVCG
jgi:hypothetical protein